MGSQNADAATLIPVSDKLILQNLGTHQRDYFALKGEIIFCLHYI